MDKLDYTLPAYLTPDNARLSASEAVDFAERQIDGKFGSIETGEPKLVFYRHKEGEVKEPCRVEALRAEMMAMGDAENDRPYLAWKVLVDTLDPRGYWEILVDAIGKTLLVVSDRRRFATLDAQVFWPDPITSSQDSTLSWDTQEVTLNEVDAQGFDGADNSHFVVSVGLLSYIAWGEGGVPDASDLVQTTSIST